MNANNLIQSADIHALSDAELQAVSGGFLFLAAAALWAIAAGVTAAFAYDSITR